MSANCDPMVYPLLFPRGEIGWHKDLKHVPQKNAAKRNAVTLLQFYSHHLAVHEGFSVLHSAGKLFQQYVVDAYVKIEASRLNYLRHNQSQLRVELYQGLMDHLHSQAAERNLTPGKMVILPSSFQGSPRAMQQNYQDAMAIIAKFGRPDLFLTFTCNPKWKEITASLQGGPGPEHRPDIVARVFKRHLDDLLIDIRTGHILGKPTAFVYVIEFQKRGLPHCHLLIVLDNDCKLRDANDVDLTISAEIPDPVEEQELYNIVKSTMVHGPCGHLNPHAPCMENKVCTKGYPKEFRERTSLDENGYPHYRRRDNGRTIDIHGVTVDNRWIVPYNPYLLKKHGAHINLESCMTIKSVKYLFKYVYKGHDCANIEVRQINELTHDEISTFMDARYVSAPEAFWRISEFLMHQQSHSIVRLPVHLPRQQPVYFQQGTEEEALQRAGTQDTMLTAWFKLNNSDAEAKQYLYPEVPAHFVFDKKNKKWKPRKRGGNNIIARMYSVSPKDMERFSLRLLLLHVPGATSYENLRTVNGVTVETFEEACHLLHLHEDDTQWDHALTEAATFQMPAQLRCLFATICIQCTPRSALQLWLSHKDSMTEDFRHRHSLSPDQADSLALQDIQSILIQAGIKCQDLKLPEVQHFNIFHAEFDLQHEEQIVAENMEKLNDEQRTMVEAVMKAADEIQQDLPPKCRAFFLDGPGGSGKTMVYNTLISLFRTRGITVAPSAWTGIAATLLSGGRTVHSLFKLPIPVDDTATCNVTPSSSHAEMLRSVTMFIVDEASMVPLHALTAIDKMLQDITGHRVPFGGKIFLTGGDFRQVLPVIPKRPPTVIVENCLKRSPLWPLFTKVHLKKNMRAHADQQEFASWLLKLGDNKLQSIEPTAPQGSVDIPSNVNIITTDIVQEVFPDLDADDLAQRAIVCPLNESTLNINNLIVRNLPGDSKMYLSHDKPVCDRDEDVANFPVELLNSITPTGMPPHALLLKTGAIIMLLRNLDIRKGLCNGTRLKIKRMHEHVLDAEVIGGAHAGHRILIQRIKLAPSDPALPFVLQRTQFPIRLAYCMTINKSQGQTFDKIGIYLPSPVFSHGQLYVAFSRARSFADVTVKIDQTTMQGKFGSQHCTQNIVYNEVL